MDKKTISEAVLPLLDEMGCFLVDVTVSAGNDIEIAIEKREGTVVMENLSACTPLASMSMVFMWRSNLRIKRYKYGIQN